MTRRKSRGYGSRTGRLARWLAADSASETHRLVPAITALNELRRGGLITEYALGGGMGAMRYVEPFATVDLDVFFIPSVRGLDAGIPAIFRHLRKRGNPVVEDSIIIGGVPVQLPATDRLTEEAVREARGVDYGGIGTRVISPEHLVARAVRTGCRKDAVRVEMLCTQAGIDGGRLMEIPGRYGLKSAFRKMMGRES
jgi:hypothetical protein